MPDPLPVALVVTTLNEERSIHPFLESLRGQSRPPGEFIVCDGGSVDGTRALLESWDYGPVSFTFLQEAGATIARGRNRAIAAARSEIIAVSDAGCILDGAWLERITRPLFDDPEADAVSGGYRLGTDTRFRRIAAAAEIPVENLPAGEFLPSSRSFAVRKSSWAAAGGYPETLTFAGEDTALCLAMKRMNMKFVSCLEASVFWYPRNSLPAYMRQHYRYGVGDGESGVKSRVYAKILMKYSIFILLAAASVFSSYLIPAPLLALGAYYIRLRPVYRWREAPWLRGIAGFCLIVVKEWCLFAGWTAGGLHRLRRSG